MSRSEEEFTSIHADIKKDTDKAILVDWHEEEVWLPRSQVENIDFNVSPPKITMTAWIAKQKGII